MLIAFTTAENLHPIEVKSPVMLCVWHCAGLVTKSGLQFNQGAVAFVQ
jgi:hypothetical protein